MRVVFMGTPDFAVPTLEALAKSEDHEVVAVYTRKDAASGRRGKELLPSKVKAAALELGLDVRTPATLRDAEVQAELAGLKPDVIVVAAFGMILPKEVLNIPPLGCINVHGSLLPRWRGAAPMQRAILAGDERAGVCIMRMEEGLDTGVYHTVGSAKVADKSTEELTAEIAQLGADGLLEALTQIEDGAYEWLEQDEALVTYAEKIEKRETLLAPELEAGEALRRIQAASPSAPARCVVCGKTVEVLAAHAVDESVGQGSVLLEKKRIVLGAASGALQLDQVKPQGKRPMEAKAWLAGLRGAEAIWSGVE